jgi:hypothetical protein
MGLFQQVSSEGKARDLQFLVIGGLAVNFHGYTRDTADLDLLIERETRGRWLEVLFQLGYTIYQDKEVFIQLSPPKDGAWPLDLMLVREPTFRQIHAAGIKTEIYGAEVLVPTLDHLLALKLHALVHGPAERYLKDYLDVENLILVNRVDLRSEKIRRLFQKHGTMELYERISRTCARQ